MSNKVMRSRISLLFAGEGLYFAAFEMWMVSYLMASIAFVIVATLWDGKP